MSLRLSRAMGRASAQTLQDLSKLTEREFLSVSRVGMRTLNEAKERLGWIGLVFRK